MWDYPRDVKSAVCPKCRRRARKQIGANEFGIIFQCPLDPKDAFSGHIFVRPWKKESRHPVLDAMEKGETNGKD